MSDFAYGPVTSYVLRQLISRQQFFGQRVQVSESLNKSLPCIWPTLKKLDCDIAEYESACREMRLVNSRDTIVVDCIDDSRIEHDVKYHTGAIPTFIQLAKRSICDYEIWKRLLNTPEDITLAGTVVKLDRYCETGRIIAWKARGLGIIVTVADSQPNNRIDALHDGFELVESNHPISGIDISVDRLLEELVSGHAWNESLSAIKDELTAFCIIALAVLNAPTKHMNSDDRHNWWITWCDRIICHSYLAVRDLAYRALPFPWFSDIE